MKSHIRVPTEYRKALKEEARKYIIQQDSGYKDRITNALLACFMLATNKCWHIGERRMCEMLAVFSDNLNDFSEYMELGVGFEIVENRLKNVGLYNAYKELVLRNQEETK